MVFGLVTTQDAFVFQWILEVQENKTFKSSAGVASAYITLVKESHMIIWTDSRQYTSTPVGGTAEVQGKVRCIIL